ncbi:putative fatty acyl-CoA reductase CG5065 [Sitophilus oryzae]|uniref:Fatty acyl-CoA reductase n=1 Tax=Sitophilus oryzae TaxID=7048 RepID=A0A6J2XZJ7_SITOR|nr:putative fatty acyl-CoA reductase CG5065 [Sitophilus oryzae]
MDQKQSLRQFFKGKNIFITGGSGFMGKALIEKLLRSCPDIENIYMLIRPKKGKSLNERLQEIFSNCLFEILQNTNPEIFKKVIPINGNVLEKNLGLSNEDRQLLIEKIHIVFNAAASVKFDDFFNVGILTNLRSARDVALLALDMKHICSFVHVSTAFCNINEKEIVEEKLYLPRGDWREAIYVSENGDNTIVNTLSHKYLEGFPNTYTYTKHLAEHCVNDLLADKIPTVIVRPTIVIPSLYEPFVGWLDNMNGPMGILSAAGAGLLRIAFGHPDVSIDCIPVDEAVKVFLVTCWHVANTGPTNTALVVNASAHGEKLMSVNDIASIALEISWKTPMEYKIWYPTNPSTALTESKLYYNINVILFHVIPAFFLDLIIRAAGYPPIIMKIQRKLYNGTAALAYFMCHEWQFLNPVLRRIFEELPESEVAEFKYGSVKDDEHVYRYLCACVNTARWILLKETKEVKPSSHKTHKLVYVLDRICKTSFFIWLFWFVFIKHSLLVVLYQALKNYWISL